MAYEQSISDWSSDVCSSDLLLALEPEAELGRDDQPIALAPDRFAEQFLVAERTIDFGGVEEGDAEVDRAVDRPRRLVHVGDLAVENVATPDHRQVRKSTRQNSSH